MEYPTEDGTIETDAPLTTPEMVTITPELAEKRQALILAFTVFRPSLRAYCLKIGVREDRVDDLLQDVWMHANLKLHQLREVRSVGFWVKRIAHRMSINRHVRSRRERQANDSEMGNEPHLFVDDVDQPLDILIAREEADAVRAGIASLKDLDRQTLDDYYLNHLTIKEIAAKEHTFIGTVKRRLHTARLRLRAVLPSDICEGGDAE